MPRGRPVRNPVEALRTSAFMRLVCSFAQLPFRGYQCEKYFEPESIKPKENGTRMRSCKWDRFLNGAHSPSLQTRKTIYAKIGYEEYLESFFGHPFWDALALGEQKPEHWQHIYHQMPEVIRQQLFINPEASPSQLIRKAPLYANIKKIMQEGNLDALTCIVCLLRDGGITAPTMLYQETEIVLFNLLVWNFSQTRLILVSNEIYGYIIQHIVHKERDLFFIRDELWCEPSQLNTNCFICNNMVCRAEDLYLINSISETYSFLYWCWHGDEVRIFEEMGEAKLTEKYHLKDTPLGLKWLIKKLNKTRPKSQRIGTVI
jgi:hypothetical protein